jgi:hypothetical protein
MLFFLPQTELFNRYAIHCKNIPHQKVTVQNSDKKANVQDLLIINIEIIQFVTVNIYNDK